MNWKLLFGLGVAAALGLGGWLGIGGRQSAPILAADDPDLVTAGRVLYAEHCASCHGVGLEGQPNWRERLPNGRLPAPPHDASGHTWHHADSVLFRIVKEGIQSVAPPDYESDMPAYDGILADHEIIAVLSYIKAQWPAEIRQRQEAITRQVAR